MKECNHCKGFGIIYYSVPHYETVTRDMASDACDASLEGQEVYCGEQEVEERCEFCNGIGQIE